MGKSLIIPGADFSANAIQKEAEWYLDDSVFTSTSIDWDDYLVDNQAFTLKNIVDGLNNKTINYVKVQKNPSKTNVILHIWHISNFSSDSAVGSAVNIVEIRDVNITNEGIGVYEFEPISLNNNETIFVSCSSNAVGGRGAMLYVPNGYEGYSFIATDSSTATLISTSNYTFQINFGFKF